MLADARLAGHAGHELRGPVAGEHEMGVAVDEAGEHAGAGGIDPLVSGHALSLDGHHHAVLDHDRCVTDQPERAVAQLGPVGDEQADPVDDGGGQDHSSPIEPASSSATSSEMCRPSHTTTRPPTTT